MICRCMFDYMIPFSLAFCLLTAGTHPSNWKNKTHDPADPFYASNWAILKWVKLVMNFPLACDKNEENKATVGAFS